MKKVDFNKMEVQTSIGTKAGIAGQGNISGNCYTCDSHDGSNDGDFCDCDEGGSDEH